MVRHKTLNNLSQRSQSVGGLSALLKDIKSLNGPGTRETVILKLAMSTLWRTRWSWWVSARDCVSQGASQGKGGGVLEPPNLLWRDSTSKTGFRSDFTLKSGGEKQNLCENGGNVMEASMADSPVLALCLTAAQLFIIYSSCGCQTRQLFSLNLWDLVSDGNVQIGFGIN